MASIAVRRCNTWTRIDGRCQAAAEGNPSIHAVPLLYGGAVAGRRVPVTTLNGQVGGSSPPRLRTVAQLVEQLSGHISRPQHHGRADRAEEIRFSYPTVQRREGAGTRALSLARSANDPGGNSFRAQPLLGYSQRVAGRRVPVIWPGCAEATHAPGGFGQSPGPLPRPQHRNLITADRADEARSSSTHATQMGVCSDFSPEMIAAPGLDPRPVRR